MNTRQPHDITASSPKRHKALDDIKKARVEPIHPADAAALNNLGVDCFERGTVRDASECFRNAISLVAPALPRSLCRAKALELPSKPSMGFVRQVSDDHAQDVMECDHSHDEVDAARRPQSPSSASTSPSTPPRNEYDEGMSSYNRPLRIDATFDESGSRCHYRRTAPVLLFNIGQLCVLEGDDAAATDYFLYALDILQPRHDSIHPLEKQEETCNDMVAVPLLHNLGHIYYRAQNYRLAKDMYSRALSVAESASTREARKAEAASLNCLGVLRFHAPGASDDEGASSRASAALELFTSSLSIRRSLLATDKEEGDSSATLEARRDMATAMNNVGRVHYMRGDHAVALTTYVEAYGMRKELLPNDHLDVAASAYNLGQTHHQLGNLDEAMELYRVFHRIVSKSLGRNHRDVAIILKCMAQVHHDRSEYADAARLYHDSLATTRKALGELHPEVASTLNKIGNMHYENSDFDAAICVYEEGLEVERAVLKREHQNIVVTLTNIAQSHKHRGNYLAALGRYTEAYQLQRTVLGEAHPKLAATLSNVAQVCCRLGQFARALDAYQEVLQIRREAHGDEHVDVAATLNSIGLVLFRQGYHELAIDSFEESLRVRRLCLGDQHRDVAVVLYNIATTHLEQGDEDKAMACYAETLRVERSSLGHDHRDLVVTLQHIANVYRQRGELDIALEYLEEVLRIEKLHGGDDHPAVARVLNKMGNVHLQRADVTKMMSCFAEATRIFEAAGVSPDNLDAGDDDKEEGDLKITGYNFYSLSTLHPECAAAA